MSLLPRGVRSIAPRVGHHLRVRGRRLQLPYVLLGALTKRTLRGVATKRNIHHGKKKNADAKTKQKHPKTTYESMSLKLKTGDAFSFFFFFAGGCGATACRGTARNGADEAPSSSPWRTRKERSLGVGGVDASEDSLELGAHFRVCPSLASGAS